MKNFYLNFDMNKEDGKTIDFIEELSKLENSSDLVPYKFKPIANIYIDCVGGENRMAALLYSFLTLSEYHYHFIINGCVSSNALLILIALNPKYVTVMRQSSSTVHLSNYNIPVSNIALNDLDHPSLYEYNDFKSYLNTLIEVYEFFLSKEEIEIIKKGEDIILSASKINNLFLELKKNNDFQLKSKNIFEITL